MTPKEKAIELADKFSAQEMVLDWITDRDWCIIIP